MAAADAAMNTSNNNPTLKEPFHNDQFESLPHAPCVSLFHRSGRVGCGTYGHHVMNGRLLHWTTVAVDSNNDEEAAAASNSQSTTTIPPYVAVMDEESYTSANIAKLVSYASQFTAGNHYGAVNGVEDVVGGGFDSDRALRGVLVLSSSSSSSSENEDSSNNNNWQYTLSTKHK